MGENMGTKFAEKVANTANNVMDAVSGEKKEVAEEKVRSTLEGLPERAKIAFRTYELNEGQIDKHINSDLEEIDKHISKIENIVFKHHLYHVNDNYRSLFPYAYALNDAAEKESRSIGVKMSSCEKHMRGLVVKKIVYSKEELQADKLNNIYSSIAELGATVALCIHRTVNECILSFLLKTDVPKDNSRTADSNIKTFANVLAGNFPGTQFLRFNGGSGSPEIYAAMPQINEACPDELRDIRGGMAQFRDYGIGIKQDSEYSFVDFLDEIFCPTQCKAISVVSGVPSLKSKDSKYINQGIEKLIDGVIPATEAENYTLLLLAEPLAPGAVAAMKNGYEQMASLITPFKGFQYNQTLIDSISKNASTSKNITNQVSDATAYSIGIGAHADASASAHADAGAGTNITMNEGTNHTINRNETYGESKGENHSTNQNENHTTGEGGNSSIQHTENVSNSYKVKDGNWGQRMKKSFKNMASGGEKLDQRGEGSADGTVEGTNWNESNSTSIGKTDGTSNTISNSTSTGVADGTSFGMSNGVNANASAGANAGASIGVSANVGINQTITSGRSYCSGINYGLSESLGMNEGITREYESIPVKNVLERLEKEIKRIDASESSGLWRFSGYVISGDRAMAQRVSHIYQGMIQGEESAVERCFVNTWNAGTEDFNAIVASLLNLEHPQFGIRDTGYSDVLPESIYCATEVNSAELALAMSLPQKAVAGLPVVTCASFGRNVFTVNGERTSDDRFLPIGKLYHMLNREDNNTVGIDIEKLTSHTFITGSTGAGKSNTIYKLIEKITLPNAENNGAVRASSDIHFLIIEPTKGDYKDIFGGWENVNVYGTNPKFTQLLRINPFSFPENIHVLEHIDRLIEIFNACWPMYAAMPAILKDAVAQSYARVGWDLDMSISETGIFPNFRILMDILPEVIRKSNYSSDTTSDYVGALVTRVNSLTTGLNGSIFNSVYEVSDRQLFEENTIVDISKIGSDETKALLMGILVMKLQEYRIDERIRNRDLDSRIKHFTVLEEAHLLLRKTSTEQSQEGANMQGKSVEMITNAIAEMRTYGEAFVIADQAPGLLDKAVIRNTNTKIVLRLPDEEDRKLVGGAIALKQEQIEEISKLPNWVAVIYQSDWLEPVLCEIEKFDAEKYARPYTYNPEQEGAVEQRAYNILFRKLFASDNRELSSDEVERVINTVRRNVELTIESEQAIRDGLQGKLLDEEVKYDIAFDLLNGKRLALKIHNILIQDNATSADLDQLVNTINAQYDIRNREMTRKMMVEFYYKVTSCIRPDNEEERLLIERAKESVERIWR